MALIPWKSRESVWDPFGELESLQSEMNKLFNTSLAKGPLKGFGQLAGAWSPAVDVYDSKDSILVKADLPGLNKDEIDINVEDDTLTIRGEKKQEERRQEKGYVREERSYGSFYRALTLPSSVETQKVSAHYKNGVLEITLPKKEEAKPKQIKVDVQ